MLYIYIFYIIIYKEKMEDEERTPLIAHTEDNDDDDDRANTTQPFDPPKASSTPGPSGEQIDMPTRNRPSKRGPLTAETSFIEGAPSGQVWTSDNSRILLANKRIKEEYPQYGERGLFTLKVKDGKVFKVSPKGGETPLFKADGKTIYAKVSKTDMKILGPSRTELINEKDEDIEELEKTIQEDMLVANDENEKNLLSVKALVKKLEKVPREKPSL